MKYTIFDFCPGLPHTLSCMSLLSLCSDTCGSMPREACALYAFRHQIDLTSNITRFNVRKKFAVKNSYLTLHSWNLQCCIYHSPPSLSPILPPTPSYPLTCPPSHPLLPSHLSSLLPPSHPLSHSHHLSSLLPPPPTYHLLHFFSLLASRTLSKR